MLPKNFQPETFLCLMCLKKKKAIALLSQRAEIEDFPQYFFNILQYLEDFTKQTKPVHV